MLVLDSKTAKVLGRLSAQEDLSLSLWWLDKASPSQTSVVLKLIERAHTDSRWFGCECTGLRTAPMLAPVLKDKTYFITRLTKRATHHEGCPFYFEQVASSASDRGGSSDVPEMGPAPSFLPESKGTKLATGERQASTPSINGKRNPSIPAMATKLCWLAQNAGWQYFPSQKRADAALLELADTIDVGGRSLKKMLRCDPRAWSEGWIINDLSREKPNAVRWWTCLIESADLKARTARVIDYQTTFQISISGDMRVSAGDVSPARFPMLALAAVKLSGGALVAHKLYAHPIASVDHWMLLDSNLERQTLADLRSVSAWLESAKAITVSIEKPLFAWHDTGERPDFVVQRRAQDGHWSYMVVETMGFDDPKYLARKQAMRGKLLQQGVEVYWDMRASDPDASKALRSAVARWALRTL